MRRVVAVLWGVVLLGACGQPAAKKTSELRSEDIQSGYAFLRPETQALQDDEFSNPGFLWVDRGREAFHQDMGEGACSSCHQDGGEGLMGVAARYPAIDEQSGELLNMEGRINTCRRRHQNLDPHSYESEDLLSLTAFVMSLSKSMPQTVEVTPATQIYFDRGEDYFFTRRGQFNMSCASCHNETWGKRLRGDTISQGHSNGFPAYRLEWQSLGSLHRRLRDCDIGVRAEPLPFGDDTYTAVEFYLAVRSQGLPLESPAIRR